MGEEGGGVRRRNLGGDRSADLAAMCGMQEGDEWQQLYEMMDVVLGKLDVEGVVAVLTTCLHAAVVSCGTACFGVVTHSANWQHWMRFGFAVRGGGYLLLKAQQQPAELHFE